LAISKQESKQNAFFSYVIWCVARGLFTKLVAKLHNFLTYGNKNAIFCSINKFHDNVCFISLHVSARKKGITPSIDVNPLNS